MPAELLFGTILGPFGDHFGTILVTFGDHFEDLLDPFGGVRKVIIFDDFLVPFGGPPGDHRGPFFDQKSPLAVFWGPKKPNHFFETLFEDPLGPKKCDFGCLGPLCAECILT